MPPTPGTLPKEAEARVNDDLRLADRRPFGHAPCRYPGCDRKATKASWGCIEHWYALTPELRAAIERAEAVERRANGRLGKAWEAVDQTAQVWLRTKGPLAPPAAPGAGRQKDLPF
jgi:hypothetical protein